MKYFALGFLIGMGVWVAVPDIPTWRYLLATVVFTVVARVVISICRDETKSIIRSQVVAMLRVLRMGGRS